MTAALSHIAKKCFNASLPQMVQAVITSGGKEDGAPAAAAAAAHGAATHGSELMAEELMSS